MGRHMWYALLLVALALVLTDKANAGGSLGALPADSEYSELRHNAPILERVSGGPILVWRGLLSDLSIPSCRFIPSCSRYGEQAVSQFGFLLGWPVAMERYLRCHTWAAEDNYATIGPFFLDPDPEDW